MLTVVKNKVYLIEKNKMFPVNVSIEKGIQKVGQEKDLPKDYQIYTLNEIFVKFNIQKEKPYYFDKEKYEKDLAEAKAKEEAEERTKIEEEIRTKIAEEEKEKTQKAQVKPKDAKTNENKPNNE